MFNSIVLSGSILSLVLFLSACASPGEVRDGGVGDSADTIKNAESAVQADSPDYYVLEQGDRIAILVFDEPDLSLNAQVSASGFINYSYLGNIQVSGKTPLQLEEHIAELLQNGYLVNPSVNVSVTEFRPFFIGGEVRSPGSYPYQPGLTLDKAIALAGGLSERASTRRMFVVSPGSSDGQKKIQLNESVGPGDTITIQEGFF